MIKALDNRFYVKFMQLKMDLFYRIVNGGGGVPNLRREIFKSVDDVKYEGQVRSGHNICCLCSFLVELSSCRVTNENRRE